MRKRIAAVEARMVGSMGYASPGRALRMPGGASAGMGFPTTMESSRGVLGDLTMGPRRTSVQLPGFGAGNKQFPDPLPSRAVPLPPRRPAEFGPITAEVKSFPPLSGTMTGTVDVGGTLKVEASPYFTTTFSGFEKRLTTMEGKVGSMGSLIAANGPGSTGKSSPDAGKGGRD